MKPPAFENKRESPFESRDECIDIPTSISSPQGDFSLRDHNDEEIQLIEEHLENSSDEQSLSASSASRASKAVFSSPPPPPSPSLSHLRRWIPARQSDLPKAS